MSDKLKVTIIASVWAINIEWHWLAILWLLCFLYSVLILYNLILKIILNIRSKVFNYHKLLESFLEEIIIMLFILILTFIAVVVWSIFNWTTIQLFDYNIKANILFWVIPHTFALILIFTKLSSIIENMSLLYKWDKVWKIFTTLSSIFDIVYNFVINKFKKKIKDNITK